MNNYYLTVVEKGDVFSRARYDPRRGRLEEIRQQLLEPCGGNDETGAMLRDKLLARASMILVQLESLAFQQETFELNTTSIEEQIERAQSRWNELPDVTLGVMPDIDKVRQHILAEKQNLMHELRQLRSTHGEHQHRSITALAEAYAEYCSTTRALATLENRSLPILALNDLLDFIPLTPEGDEVVVLEPPRVVPSGGGRLP